MFIGSLLPGIPPAAVAQRGQPSGVVLLVEAEESGVDYFVLVDEDGAGEGLGFVAVVGAVADGGELAFFGAGDLCQEFLGATAEPIRGGGLPAVGRQY